MASGHYFASWNGTAESGKVELDRGPDPFTIIPVGERTVSVKKCLPGAGGPGNTRVFDAGVGLGSYVINATFRYMKVSEYYLLKAKYDVIAQIIYSPDNGTTKYICAWGSSGLVPAGITGSAITCSVNVSLRIMGVAT